MPSHGRLRGPCDGALCCRGVRYRGHMHRTLVLAAARILTLTLTPTPTPTLNLTQTLTLPRCCLRLYTCWSRQGFSEIKDDEISRGREISPRAARSPSRTRYNGT